MFNLQDFISNNVIMRSSSMFKKDLEDNHEALLRAIQSKRICVIGGAGSIGSSFIRAILRYQPSQLIVVDLNEGTYYILFYTMPCAIIASATFSKPAMFAPIT